MQESVPPSKHLVLLEHLLINTRAELQIAFLSWKDRSSSDHIPQLVLGIWLHNLQIMCQLTVDWLSVDSRPIDRPTVDQYIGWCIGRQSVNISVDYRLTISQLSTNSRSIVDRYIGRQSTNISANSRPINVYISGDALVDYRSIYWSTIGQLSVDYWSTVSRLSVDCQPIVDQ